MIVSPDHKPILISQTISRILGSINVSVLMGANIASHVATGPLSEATIGYSDENAGLLWKTLFHNKRYCVSLVKDIAGVELCGSLKNVVAIGAGFVDGSDFGENAKAAIVRIGLEEMMRFAKRFFDGVQPDTFFESCGIADLIVTCYDGRNRKVAEAFVRTGMVMCG